MIAAGKIDNLFTVQLPTDAQSDTGEITTTYADSGTVWGSLDEPNSKELKTAETLKVLCSHVIRCRLSALISNVNRLKLRDRIFTINHYQKDDRQREMVVYVTEVIE